MCIQGRLWLGKPDAACGNSLRGKLLLFPDCQRGGSAPGAERGGQAVLRPDCKLETDMSIPSAGLWPSQPGLGFISGSTGTSIEEPAGRSVRSAMPLPHEYKDVFLGRELRKRAANGALIYGEVRCCSSLLKAISDLSIVSHRRHWCRCTI